jgi:hypothetical protein
MTVSLQMRHQDRIKVNIFSSDIFTSLQLRIGISLFATRQFFPVLLFQTSVPFYGKFGSSCVQVQIYHSDLLMLSASSL